MEKAGVYLEHLLFYQPSSTRIEELALKLDMPLLTSQSETAEESSAREDGPRGEIWSSYRCLCCVQWAATSWWPSPRDCSVEDTSLQFLLPLMEEEEK